MVGSRPLPSLITTQQLDADADPPFRANDVPMGLYWLASRKRLRWHA